MSDPNERDSKLVQYMNEAYGKERELESSLLAHIEMTTKAPYKKRLKQHLSETKKHAKALERRIKKLGGGGHAVQTIVAKAAAAAKGPVHALRGSGEQEKMLKNAKTEYFNEHEEISTYLALETFATKVGDKETAKLAREIRRDEERMAKFLEGQIKALSNAVALDEVPSAQRRPAKVSASAKRPAAKKARAASKASSSKKAAPKRAAKPKTAKAKSARPKSVKKTAKRKTAAKSKRAGKSSSKAKTAKKASAGK
jgi:ferritin-like metal-binding protein YciE